MGLITEGVPGGGELEAHRGGDVPGQHFVDLVPLVGPHLHQPPDSLPLALGRIPGRHPAGQSPGIDPDEGQRPYEGVGHDLEGQRAEGSRVAGGTGHLVPGLGVLSVDRGDVQRRGEEVDHCIQQRLDPLVLEGRAAQNREELAGGASLAQRGQQLLRRGLPPVEVGMHDVVVLLGAGLHQMRPGGAGRFQQLPRNVHQVVAAAQLGLVEDQGLHRDQVDDP